MNMKRIIFLLAAIALCFTGQAQRISDTAPPRLEGENIYLVLKDASIAQQIVSFCDGKFAGGNLLALSLEEYYKQVTTGDGYIIAAVNEVVNEESNCQLMLRKANTKAVVKKPASNGVFVQDPTLVELASFLVDPGKLNSMYSALYVRSLDGVLFKYNGLSEEEKSVLFDKTAALETTEFLVLRDEEMEDEINDPEEINKIHPVAVIEDQKDILERIEEKNSIYAIAELMLQQTVEGQIGFIRIFGGDGRLLILREVEFEEELQITTKILNKLLTEDNALKAAGKS